MAVETEHEDRLPLTVWLTKRELAALALIARGWTLEDAVAYLLRGYIEKHYPGTKLKLIP